MGLLHAWLLAAAVAGATTPYRGGAHPRRASSRQQTPEGNELLNGIGSSVAFSDASASDLAAERGCPKHSQWTLPLAACVCEHGFVPSKDFGRSCLPGAAASSVFDALDANQNGILDRQEFMRGIQATEASTQNANDPPGPFEQSDLDEDGFIERAEFSGPKGLNNIVLPRFPQWIDAVKVAVSLVIATPIAGNALLSAAATAPALLHHPAIVQAIKLQQAWFDEKNAKQLFAEVAALDNHSSYVLPGNRAVGQGALKVLVAHLRDGGFLPAYSRGQGSCLAAEVSLADLGTSGRPSRGISPSQRDSLLSLLTACYTLVPQQAAFGLQAAFHVVDLSLAGVPTCCSKLLELDNLMQANNVTRLDLRIRAAEIQMICGNSSGAVHILHDALAPHGYGFPTPDHNFLGPGKYTGDAPSTNLAVPLAAQFLASRLAVMGRLSEAEALCQRLVHFGFSPPEESGTTCATTFAVVHTRRGNFRQALRELLQEKRVLGSTRTRAVDGRSEKLSDMRRDRHAAEIVTAWLHASRFREGPAQQPALAHLGALVNSSNSSSAVARDTEAHVSNMSVTCEEADAINGGWGQRENLDLTGDGRCNIDVRYPGIDITPEQFQREFLFLNRPVVLRGLCRNWTAMKSWGRGPLLENYGDLMFKAKRGSDIAQDKIHANDPAFAEGLRQRNEKIGLRQFLQQELPAHAADSILSDSDPKYILDQPPRPILDSGDFPSLLDPWFPSNLTYSQAQRDEQALMYIGRTNSGTNLHAHTNAWNALFFGKKRWFLFPPQLAHAGFPKNKLKPMTQWVQEDYPTLRNFLYECTQLPGDVLYAPGYFDHAVLNLQDSLGVAVQVGDPVGLGNHVLDFVESSDILV